jgi:glucose-1-phosphate adenylyltransferase
MAGQRVLGMILAGGAGERLAPLTADRAKAAVAFGGLYRLVDFTLSSLVHGGIRRICVLTQYKSHSLDRHITTTWQLNSLLDNYVTPVPAQQRLGPRWQTGSADAIYQSLNLIDDERPDLVAVFGADHVYRMDPVQMIDRHTAWGAGVTVAAVPVPRMQATGFGVV